MCLIPQTEPVGEDKVKILSTNKNRIRDAQWIYEALEDPLIL
jgi:hypothetical protein